MLNSDQSQTGLALEKVALPAPGPDLLDDASLFLDFDGTLVNLAPRPDDVFADARLRALFSLLSTRFPGRVGIISGRPIAQLQAFTGDVPLVLAGSHGAEILLADGTIAKPARPDSLNDVVDAMTALQARHPGIIVERKPFGAGLHYRGAPEAEDECRALAITLAASSGLLLQAGKMVFELRVPGADKGSALRALLKTPAMIGTKPIFIGDDETDEAAFIVADELGGMGILVGAERPTAARYRLHDVAATLNWLEAVCGDKA